MNKKSAIFSMCCAVLVLIGSRLLNAQTTSGFTHTVTSTLKSGQQPGRDFWFSLAQMYDAGGAIDKHYILYVTSPKKTVVYIQGDISSSQYFPVGAGEVVSFKIPLSWEATSSGIIENKGIHVWSSDADLSCSVLARNPESSDGMCLIPTAGLGKENVVASYTSLFSDSFDYPSEFYIVSPYDNNEATIAPHADIRASRQPDVTLHSAKNLTFTDFFMHGQCAQYQATKAKNIFDYDLTGSVITSTKPVAVIGANLCANIPAEFNGCSYICEMIPPVRSWGTKYYTAPFINRTGGDSFTFIASTDGQTINYVDANGHHPYGPLAKYQVVAEPDVASASSWYSDKPFLLVQYLNSTEWPARNGANTGIGAPSMVVIAPVDQFVSKYTFQTPTILQGDSAYTNYINVVLPPSAESSTYFDGAYIASVRGARKILIDNVYEVIRLSDQSAGTHTLTSTQPIGGYVYGYGPHQAYSWPISLGSITPGVGDLTAPAVLRTSQSCACAHVLLGDAHISQVLADTLANISLQPAGQFLNGDASDTASYDLCVLRPDSAAFGVISVYDEAGNRTQIATTYFPSGLSLLGPPLLFLDSSASLELKNLGPDSINIKNLRLRHGDQGFSIAPLAVDILAAGDSVPIQVFYQLHHGGLRRDTMELSDKCNIHTVALMGGGWTVVQNENNDSCLRVGDSATINLTVTNATASPVTFKSIVVSDQHFTYTGSLPLMIAAGAASPPLTFKFKPTNSEIYNSLVTFNAVSGDSFQTHLTRCAKFGVSSVRIATTGQQTLDEWLSNTRGSRVLLLPPNPNPAIGASKRIAFTIGLRERASLNFAIYDLLGKKVATISTDLWHPEGISTLEFDASTLFPGSYVYRLEALGEIKLGKLSISQ